MSNRNVNRPKYELQQAISEGESCELKQFEVTWNFLSKIMDLKVWFESKWIDLSR